MTLIFLHRLLISMHHQYVKICYVFLFKTLHFLNKNAFVHVLNFQRISLLKATVFEYVKMVSFFCVEIPSIKPTY